MKRFLSLAILLLVVVRLHNAFVVPSGTGFDSRGHSENILLLDDGVVPLANEGPQSYHPPGYAIAVHLAAAAVPLDGDRQLLRLGHFVSVFGSLLALVCTFFIARTIVPGWEPHAVLVAALIPAELLTSSTVYNGPLAYGLITFMLLLVQRAIREPTPRLLQEAGLGLVAGAATMVRLDCIMSLGFLGAVWAYRLFRGVSWRDATVALALSLAGWLALVQWFFLRNLSEFGRLLVFNLDHDVLPYSHMLVDPSGYPGYISLAFFTTLDPHIWVDPQYGSAVTSFWSMNYVSLWWDHNEKFLSHPNIAAARALLTLGLVPTALWFVGLGVVARKHLERGWPLLLVQLMSWCVYFSLFFNHPTLPQVKANFLYAGYAAASICVAAGLKAVTKTMPKVGKVLEITLLVLAILVAYVFWWVP